MANPLVSVIFVSYRSRADLARCLPSLYAQSFRDFEAIVIDNAPEDGTATWLSTAYPDVTVLSNPTNTGYAGGNNFGFEHAKGRFVLVLNPDTELLPGALETLVEVAKAHPTALVNAKLLCPDGTVNACGLEMHYTGISSCRGLGEAAERFTGLHDIPLISGAAFISRKEVLLALGGFEPSYFMYLEDVELSLRARLAGLDLLCAADAAIIHHYTLQLSPEKFYYLERNRLLTLFRVFEERTLKRMLPALLLTELATWSYALLKGAPYAGARWRGLVWIWRSRKGWLAARKETQARRQLSDATLLAHMGSKLPFEQLLGSRFARPLERLTGPLYQLCRPRLEPFSEELA